MSDIINTVRRARKTKPTTQEVRIMKYWYAVMMDREDTDWGYGSFDLDEAKAKASKYPESYIAVIDGGYDEDGNETTDPICVDEIMQEDF